MKKILFRLFVILWVAVLALLGLYYLLLSPRESSFDESENRALAAAPALSAETVFGGGLSESMENWLADHVPQRRTLIGFHQRLRDTLSFASYEDSLAVIGRVDDALAGELSDDEFNALAEQMLAPTPAPEVTL